MVDIEQASSAEMRVDWSGLGSSLIVVIDETFESKDTPESPESDHD